MRTTSVIVGWLLFAASAAAQLCPSGNLLEGAAPVEYLDIYHVERVTDGIAAEEGSPWDSSVVSPLSNYANGYWDLGSVVPIRALYLQAEGRSSYLFETSYDGNTWSPMTTVPSVGQDGMRERYARGLEREARYLRLRAQQTEAFFAVGELAVWCEAPQSWPPTFPRDEGVVRDAAWSEQRDRRLAWSKLALVLIGGALLISGRWKRPAAIVVGIAGIFAWTNFGSFHGPNVTHYHDSFHYYLGSHYADELGYDGIYACTVWAERELGLEASVRNRYVTDLTENRLVPGATLLATAPDCRSKFSDERWATFRDDVRFFRNQLYPGSWQRLFRDHGYNATPTWTAVGSLVPGIGVWLDFVLLAIGFGAIGWAFGLRALALTLLIFGTGFPWDYAWNGGAMLRAAWFASFLCGFAALKKERWMLGGVFLGAAAVLRLFPIVFLLAIAFGWLLTRRREALRVLTGAMVVIVLVLPIGDWVAFTDNLRKHASTPIGNQMGLPVVMAFDAEQTQTKVIGSDVADLDRWKKGRRDTLQRRTPIRWGLTLIAVGALGWLLRRSRLELWEWIPWAVAFPMLGAALNGYDYVFFLALAVWVARSRVGIALIVATAAITQLVALTDWATDVRYLVFSLLFLPVGLALIAHRLRSS